jgi:hypothetical protein
LKFQPEPLRWFVELYQYNQALQLVINLAWDVLFSLDAVLCTVLWYQNAKDVLAARRFEAHHNVPNRSETAESLIDNGDVNSSGRDFD